jgi:hypothetical protein
MGTKTINVGEVVKDIRAGMADNDLMEKYHLGPKTLQSLFEKLLEAGAIQQSDLDLRNSNPQETPQVEQSTEKSSSGFTCPACKMPQSKQFDECPQCGVIIPKFKEKQAKETEVKKWEDLKKLLNGAAEGNVTAVRNLLHKGVDINTIDHDGRSPLVLAASRGHAVVVRLLLKKGADPTIRGVNGRTALFEAHGKGHYAVVKMLSAYATQEELEKLEKKADVKTVLPNVRTGHKYHQYSNRRQNSKMEEREDHFRKMVSIIIGVPTILVCTLIAIESKMEWHDTILVALIIFSICTFYSKHSLIKAVRLVTGILSLLYISFILVVTLRERFLIILIPLIVITAMIIVSKYITPTISGTAQEKKLITYGYMSAILSVLIIPPAFGSAGMVCGIITLAKSDKIGHGIAIVIISISCGFLGLWLGLGIGFLTRLWW